MSNENNKIEQVKEFVDSRRAAVEEELQWAENATMENKEFIVAALRQQLILLEELTQLLE